MHESERRKPDYIASLDGIRALAVGLVFVAHSGLERWVPGGLGVTVFFVLSGFLITTLMRAEQRDTGSISYRAFYLRRALRLMPPLLVVVALALLISELGWTDGEFTLGGLLSVILYLGNYYVIAEDFAGLPAGLGVVWSLAVEEHFYLFYPPLALLLMRAARPALASWAMVGLCTVVLAWRCYLATQPGMEAHIGMATDTRIDAILVGCLLGFSADLARDCDRPLSGRELLCVPACLLVLAASLALRDEFFRNGLRYTVQSLAIAPLIYLAVIRSGHWAFRWLNARVLIYIGGISYSIYLAHHLVLNLLHKHAPDLGWAATAVLGALISVAVAEGIRRWIELPCGELRRRLRRRPGMPEPWFVGRPAGVA